MQLNFAFDETPLFVTKILIVTFPRKKTKKQTHETLITSYHGEKKQKQKTWLEAQFPQNVGFGEKIEFDGKLWHNLKMQLYKNQIVQNSLWKCVIILHKMT